MLGSTRIKGFEPHCGDYYLIKTGFQTPASSAGEGRSGTKKGSKTQTKNGEKFEPETFLGEFLEGKKNYQKE